MFRGNDIEKLIKLLEKREVFLFHACQLIDFQSYVALNAIPSRSCLENNNLCFTKFDTDNDDHLKGIWDKVFLNFSDFGEVFAKGGNWTPNPYGPILLKVHPRVLCEATDIAISLRPVGNNDFDREICSLKYVEDVEGLFAHPVWYGYDWSTILKDKDILCKEYQLDVFCNPDISCAVKDGGLPFKYVHEILIDPYTIGGNLLLKYVNEVLISSNIKHSVRIRERYTYEERRGIYNELVNLTNLKVQSCRAITQSINVSAELRYWIQKIEHVGLEYQFNRFSKYLREGTLFPMY